MALDHPQASRREWIVGLGFVLVLRGATRATLSRQVKGR
jgi:hypothetical protein